LRSLHYLILLKEISMIKSFENCTACEHHKDMNESFVRCSHIKEFNVMVISQPSHYNEGFKNGERIVRCPKEVT